MSTPHDTLFHSTFGRARHARGLRLMRGEHPGVRAFLDEPVLPMRVGGDWRLAAAGGPSEVRDPASGELVARVASGGPADTEAAIAGALAGFEDGSWSGLRPEERWWLYTATAAATGTLADGDVGWRKALRYALTENPTDATKLRSRARRRPVGTSELLPLFEKEKAG